MTTTRRGFLASVAAMPLVPYLRYLRTATPHKRLTWHKGKWKDGRREWIADVAVPVDFPVDALFGVRTNSDGYRGTRPKQLLVEYVQYWRKADQWMCKITLREYSPRVPVIRHFNSKFQRIGDTELYEAISYVDLFREIEDACS